MAVQLFLRFPDQDEEILNLLDGREFIEDVIQTIRAVSQDILENKPSADIFYDSENIEAFLEKIAILYEPEYLKHPGFVLKQTLQAIGKNWRDKPLHIPLCNYVLWKFEAFTIEQVLNTSFAELAERILQYSAHQYLLLNITSAPFKRKYLPVFKDTLHDDTLPRFVQIHFVSDYDEWLLWWNFYREKTELTQFSLLDKQRFKKTRLVEQGKPVYQEITTGYYWYLDNFHRNEYEVFDKYGHHLGVADLNGTIDETQKINGRTIDVN